MKEIKNTNEYRFKNTKVKNLQIFELKKKKILNKSETS